MDARNNALYRVNSLIFGAEKSSVCARTLSLADGFQKLPSKGSHEGDLNDWEPIMPRRVWQICEIRLNPPKVTTMRKSWSQKKVQGHFAPCFHAQSSNVRDTKDQGMQCQGTNG